MQRDPVALAVDDDGAVAVRTDRLRRLDHAAAMRHHRPLGVDDAAVDVEIDERPAWRRRVGLVGGVETTGDVAAGVGEEPERESRAAFARHRAFQHRGIERDRTLEIVHGDVDPDEAMAHGELFLMSGASDVTVAAVTLAMPRAASAGPLSSTTLPSGSSRYTEGPSPSAP